MSINQRKVRFLLVFLLGLVLAGFLLFTVERIHWRGQLIAMKVRGELVDISWNDVYRFLLPLRWRPAGYNTYTLLTTRNPHTAIRNTYTTDSDLRTGEEIFRASCAACHGIAGGGGDMGPSLREELSHGNSDLSLFRTISDGLPGTPMRGVDLTEESIWQLVSFLRSLTGLRTDTGSEDLILPPLGLTYERLLNAHEDPGNWLMYSGTYNGHRHSRLSQINTGNAKDLKLKWAFKMQARSLLETTPLVVGNLMYVTGEPPIQAVDKIGSTSQTGTDSDEPHNAVIALDTRTGRLVWSYGRPVPDGIPLCCGPRNRGVALLDDTLYMGTLDAHLVAIDGRTGSPQWDTKVAEYREGYSITSAPLVVKDKVITGVAGGEYGIRGFLDAYDAKTGKRLWRFYTVPDHGQPGNDTWEGDSWKTGGAPTWLTGSFDPELNLLYWGVGNPGPALFGDDREGDNLYSDSVIALNPDTGELMWHFQFTPHDENDWDANQIPVLVDTEFGGMQRKLLLWANRNAFFYVLDRQTGEFLSATEFAKQNWAERIRADGRPIVTPNATPSRDGTLVYPATATNWWSPSYSPETGLFYVPVSEMGAVRFKSRPTYEVGELFFGSVTQGLPDSSHSALVRALSPQSGEVIWEHKLPTPKVSASQGGILSTSGNLVFVGSEREFFALDARTGKELWRVNTGGTIVAAPITYLSDGSQQVTVAAETMVFTFGLESLTENPQQP